MIVEHEITPAPAQDATSQAALAVVAKRMVVSTAHVALRSRDIALAARQAAALATAAGGFVAHKETSGTGEDIEFVNMSLRVSSPEFELTLAGLRELGDVLSERLGGEDVTEQHVDLAARLRSKRALEQRLLAILSTANTVTSALEVELQLGEVRTSIERLDAQLRNLEHRAALATIELSIASPQRQVPRHAESLGSQMERAGADAREMMVWCLLAGIRALGVIAPLSLLVVLGVALRRRLRG